MKVTRLLLPFILVLLFAGNASAQVARQWMQLRPSGFVGPDSVTNYIVINAPKVSKADLYSRALTYINGLYNNPQSVVTTVPGASITVNAVTDAIIDEKLTSYKYPTRYNIVLEFKDGKIKIAPKIASMKEVWSENQPARDFYVSSTFSPVLHDVNCIWLFSEKKSSFYLFRPSLKATADAWINNYISGLVTKVNENW